MTNYSEFNSKNVTSRSTEHKEFVNIGVNGTLMRGLELETNLVNLRAKFVREDYTERTYRLFSIDDIYPGMVRIPPSGL